MQMKNLFQKLKEYLTNSLQSLKLALFASFNDLINTFAL